MKTFISCLASCVCLFLSACATAPVAPSRVAVTLPADPLILVSIDAFRADYYDRGLTPNLKSLADGGVRAVIHPAFPSLTFPNHYTLVTGLRPDEHGVIANNMVDPTHPADPADPNATRFGSSKAADGFWWKEATPMWVSAEKAGEKVGIMFWPGSQAEIGGVRPTYWVPYAKSTTADARVAQVLQWADLPGDQRPQVYLLYFDMVDEAGHNFGSDSPEMTQALTTVDTAIGTLRDGFAARGIHPNFVIVSDHGMAAVDEARTYYLSDLLGTDGLDPAAKTDPRYDFVNYGTVAMLNPAPGSEKLIDDVLVHRHYDHMQCWHKRDIPAHLHFGHNPRVPEIVCLADDGWLIGNLKINGKGYKFGAHGYDPKFPDMNAIFIGNGPAFNAGVVLKPFDNVNIYDLEMKLTGVPALPNDGSLKPFAGALKP